MYHCDHPGRQRPLLFCEGGLPALPHHQSSGDRGGGHLLLLGVVVAYNYGCIRNVHRACCSPVSSSQLSNMSDDVTDEEYLSSFRLPRSKSRGRRGDVDRVVPASVGDIPANRSSDSGLMDSDILVQGSVSAKSVDASENMV